MSTLILPLPSPRYCFPDASNIAPSAEKKKKKSFSSIMAFTHFDFYQYSVMGRWMLSNYNHPTSVFWRTVTVRKGQKNKRKKWYDEECSAISSFSSRSHSFSFSSSVLACFCSAWQKKRGVMKEGATYWTAAHCNSSNFLVKSSAAKERMQN